MWKDISQLSKVNTRPPWWILDFCLQRLDMHLSNPARKVRFLPVMVTRALEALSIVNYQLRINKDNSAELSYWNQARQRLNGEWIHDFLEPILATLSRTSFSTADSANDRGWDRFIMPYNEVSAGCEHTNLLIVRHVGPSEWKIDVRESGSRCTPESVVRLENILKTLQAVLRGWSSQHVSEISLNHAKTPEEVNVQVTRVRRHREELSEILK